MFLTEEEAENKQCCGGEKIGYLCRASKCMAWRWSNEPRKIKEQPSYDYPSGRIVTTEIGYCGLAGRPTK